MGPRLLGGFVSGTISHHLWDHRSMVLFSDFSEKRGRLICFGMNLHRRSISGDRFLAEIDGQCDINRIFQ